MNEEKVINHYYVDEAGDLTFFDKRGRIIVGKPGVSQLFMIGVAHLPNPKQAAAELQQLRHGLLSDPYFKSVPSMQPESKKTCLKSDAKYLNFSQHSNQKCKSPSGENGIWLKRRSNPFDNSKEKLISMSFTTTW